MTDLGGAVKKTIFLRLLLPLLLVSLAGGVVAEDATRPKDADVYWKRVMAFMEKNEFEKAIEESNKTLQGYPKFRTAYMIRGACYAELKQLDKAIADFTQAIQLDPKDATGYRNRSIAYSNKGEKEKALADLTEAKRLEAK